MRMEAGPRPRAMKNPISEFPPPIVSAMEQRMRPGRLSESGFLDNSEHLIDVIDRDLESLANVGITPTQIADSLEAAVAQAFRVKSPFDLWNPGVRIGPWELRGESWRGTQDCPFVNADGVVCHGESYSQWDFSLINIRKRTFLAFPGLAIHLIREHRFFEGNVPHRVDPLVACEVLDVETSERRYVEPEKLSECIVESTWRSGVRFFLKSRRANEHVGLPIRRAHGHLRFAVERLKYHLVHRFQRNWVDDPTFGRLEYYDRSRWHGNWMFPPAGENVAIFLPGDRRGLSPGVRDFFETLPDRFDSILSTLRPRLDEIFRRWLQRPLGESLWDDLELTRLEGINPSAQPPEWNMVFELRDEHAESLWITVLLVGDSLQVAIVDVNTE